jgi:Zn-dependent protease with chaperone function
MFAKPFSLILVYIITCFNLLFILSPFLAILLPFIDYQKGEFIISGSIFGKLVDVFGFVIFLISFLMLIYLFLDFIFGFSVRYSLKKCKKYEKYKEYDFLTPIFSQVKEKFGENSVHLYIKNSSEINAYAVASLGSKAVVITRGMIDHYLVLCPEPKMFLSAIRSIISHEMSHLINKDFLPSFITMTNQKVTNFVSRVLRFVFFGIANLVSIFPYGGRSSAFLMSAGYNFFNSVFTFFNSFIVYNIYDFLSKFTSRSIEYRCDMQASKAFGGKNMSFALSMLGVNGYFTIFSTHPKTISRIKKIENIKISEGIIKPALIDSIINHFSLLFLAFITLIFAKIANIDILVREIIRNHETLHRKLSILWNLLMKIY